MQARKTWRRDSLTMDGADLIESFFDILKYEHQGSVALHRPPPHRDAVRRNLDGTRGKLANVPAADDDYNAGAAALGPSLITAVNHPHTTLFWDGVIFGLVALVAVGRLVEPL